MISFVVKAVTRKGISAEFRFDNLDKAQKRTENGIRIRLAGADPYELTLTPPPEDAFRRISYTASTNLKNFHEVIVPDTGRGYSSQTQLVGFWAQRFKSRLSNVRVPLFILTGTNLSSEYAFGVIGANMETDFIVREPAAERALVAWMKRFTLEIQRGTEDFGIPESVATAAPDGSITECIYFKEHFAGPAQTWVDTLREFCGHMSRLLGKSPRTTGQSLRPYWCSWTDWFSDNVTGQVILDNATEGVKLGISNYIIDDGWFGPGLDSDLSVKLNIGDWREDPAKIPDLARLVGRMHDLGANAIIWCAPHAVAPDAKCFGQHRKLLIKLSDGEYLMTHNKFHSLCFMCPEARLLMAEICADLVRRYDVDGAKYDLFNCVPDVPCASDEHRHDTQSMIEGLALTLELIDEKTRAVKEDYIVELKQNYATPYLYEYGTAVRAGDTPYNSEGNFLRTAFINAYTPYSMNDYQTITNSDSCAAAACIIIKMLAVGIPSYSIDLTALSDEHKRILAFLNRWYVENLPEIATQRVPLDGRLGCWVAGCETKDIYFVINDENRIPVQRLRPIQIACGTHRPNLRLTLPAPSSAAASVQRACGPEEGERHFKKTSALELPAAPGDIITVNFE